MAKGKGEIKGWITKNGVHIPIYGHYSVRGGEEPKAKKSTFKRRKKPEEFDKDIREGSGKFWAQHSSEQGRKKGVKDLEKPFETREGARKFLAEENGEYEKVDFAKKEDYTKNDEQKKKWQDISDAVGDYDANKDTGSNYLEERKNQAAKENAAEVRKTTNGDFSLEDYERRQQEKATKKIEATEQSFKDKKAQELGFADDASMRSYNEETGVNRETWEKGKMSGQESSKVASNGAPRVSDEDAGHNKEVEWNGGKYQTQQVRDWDSDKKQEYVAGHLYVPIDPKNGEKQFFVANEDGSVHSSGTDYLNKKSQGSSSSSFSPESSAKAINDMTRRRANGGGKKDDWKIAQEAFESAPAGTTVIETGNRGVKFQYTKGEDGTWYSSAGEEYNSDSKELAMSWVGDSGPRVEFTTSDKALSKEDIQAFHTAATSGRLSQALGLDKNGKAIGNRSVPKVASSSETPQSVKDMRKQSVQDSLSAGMNKRGQIRAQISDSNKAKSGDYSSMTVSGLKAAMAGARPGDKSKIRAELRKRGYSYVGGKWVKA